MTLNDRIEYDLKHMDWKEFYFSGKGRIARYQYNLFVICPVLILNFAMTIVQNMLNTSVQGIIIGGLVSVVITLITIYPLIVTTNKRLHDRGASGWRQMAYIGGFSIGFILMAFLGAQINPQTLQPIIKDTTWMAIGIFMSLFSLAGFVIDICFLKGQDNDNKYGPTPLKTSEEHDKGEAA